MTISYTHSIKVVLSRYDSLLLLLSTSLNPFSQLCTPSRFSFLIIPPLLYIHRTSFYTPQVRKEIFDVLEMPSRFPALFPPGAPRRHGLLLFGPPGTGKTLVARAGKKVHFKKKFI
jgi:hypothetical protein